MKEREKETVRVSFDVPVEEHTFLKTECTKYRIPFRNLMRKMFHETCQELRKTELHEMLSEGFKDAYEGRKMRLTDDQLKKWNEILNDE